MKPSNPPETEVLAKGRRRGNAAARRKHKMDAAFRKSRQQPAPPKDSP